MLQQHIASVLTRDLRAARRELEAYPSDEALWSIPEGVANSAGSLGLHLAGNIRHFIGTVLGSSTYVRDRNAEFGGQPVPRDAVLRELDLAIEDVAKVVPAMSDEAFTAPFPSRVGPLTVNTTEFLLHLSAHFGYHLGQIDYHRRIVTGENVTIGAMSVSELRTAQAAVA